ncbi:hypothetical protein [Hydrogenophaga taeniospiralis]|uniref:hypothetical protein n=1 Tax=Hydrogenophaga taeniospiralis TaxID=65656 RepID=UPI001CFAB0E4|nr:hypothetical protein [Hydrogenophaga taeniospiralis]UCU95230.1 hypothetical protein KI616_05050 [Hydrogenophaga taeniospiralis]
MATSKRAVQFANFICHFGDLEMLDLAEEVVIPAFTNSTLKRRYKDTSYFFHNVELMSIQTDGKISEPAIVGKFVKDTILQRDQIFEDGQLVKSIQKLPSAPSSLFVLILRDHKLLFLPEVAGAPGLDSFCTTTERFLKHAHEAFQKSTFESILQNEFPDGANREQKKEIKESIQKRYPNPNLEVVSLASEETLEAFVDRFDKLKAFSIKLLKPNNEINNEGLFKQFRAQGSQLHATSSTVSYRNTEGLVKAEVKDHAESALDGNAEVALSGTDSEGRKLSGSNDDFKIQVVVDSISRVMKLAAQQLFSVFRSYKNSGQIRTGVQETSVEKEVKLARLAKQFSGGQDGNT